ncbi:MAG TPA: HAMP domain-containing protein, partial [Clostridia bacterium]|nr:HAMP domain-containing protein [Clostridia bacterium]
MRKRFFRAAGLSIIIGLIAAFLFAVPLIGKVYTDETEKRLDAALSLMVGYSLPEKPDYQVMAKEAGRNLKENNQDLRITIIDENGTVLGDSEADPAQMENHASRPEIIQALQSGKGKDIRRSFTVGQKEMYRANLQTMPDGSHVIYRTSIELKSVDQVHSLLWGCGLIGIFIGLMVALATANYSAGRVVKPLQQLTQAARRLAEGSEAVRVEEAPDEMGELSSAFNRMSERLSSAHIALEQSNERMASILQGMEDGVIALDTDGDITLLTRRARELLGPSPQNAIRLSDCGTNYSYIQNLMDRVAAGESPLRETIVLAGKPERILQVYTVKVSGSTAGGTLAVLSDVTRMRKLETMRSEFVA